MLKMYRMKIRPEPTALLPRSKNQSRLRKRLIQTISRSIDHVANGLDKRLKGIASYEKLSAGNGTFIPNTLNAMSG